MKTRNLVTLFVALSAAAEASGWWTLAYEGELRGRNAALTREDFESCIKNFRHYGRSIPVPLYHADLDAKAHPESRKAHAWIDDLRLGTMEIGGKTVATLEGKRRWAIESTRADVECGAIVGGSITIFHRWVDDATGENMGPYLYSFSLTNNPALTHLPALAASQSVSLGYWCGDLDTRDDVLAMLRSILDLPVMTDEAATLAELAKLERLAGQPENASGVEVDDIVSALRQALRMPALTTPAEVIAAVRKALTTLPTEAPAALSQRAPTTTPTTEFTTMTKLLALSALMGLTPKNDDEAATALETRVREGGNVRQALNLSASATSAEVAASIAKLSTDAARLPAVVTELEAFKRREAEALSALRKAWIDDVLAAGSLPDSVRPSLELHASSDWAGFQKLHPRPTAEELGQRAQDRQRLPRAPINGRGARDVPAPQTGAEDAEPSVDDIGAAAEQLMAQHGVSFAEAIEMLEQG